MEQHNYLGIYLARNSATVVVLHARHQTPTILTSFTVTSAPDKQTSPPDDDDVQQSSIPLPARIIQDLNERNIVFTDAFIALDCSQFSQHRLHSEFTDSKQIAQTIKFDVEAVAATDAAELAVTFRITSTDQSGSDLAAFTGNRKLLEEILADLQQNNIDPITIEPDIICLVRFLLLNLPESDRSSTLYVIISRNCCYIVNLSQENQIRIVRSFLVTRSQNKTDLLATQIPITIASNLNSVSEETTIDSLVIASDCQDIDYEALSERIGLTIQQIDLTQIAAVDPVVMADCDSNTNFAIATGAALADVSKNIRTDFREDFSPYLGKKLLIQKSLRLLVVSLTILMFAVAGFFQIKASQKNGYTAQLKQKMEKDYSAVMFGKKPPNTRESIASILGRRRKELEQKGAGASFADDKSVPAKLTYVLQAFNSVPKNVKLNINNITVSSKNVRITGNTNSRSGTMKLRDAIKKHEKLKLDSESVKDSGGQSSFTINVKSK